MIKPGSPEHRARIVARARRTRVEILQIFTDAESWNQNSVARKNGAAPVDPDPDGLLRRTIDAIDFFLACEDAAGGVGPMERIDVDGITSDTAEERERH